LIALDSNGKSLSSTFNNQNTALSKKLKPKVEIDFLDSRHLDNLTVTTNDDHASSSEGNSGFYFNKNEACNGINRETYAWAVADAKDVYGKTIKADGSWYAMPVNSDETLEYGWWSASKSTSTAHSTYSGYEFSTNPTVTATFDDTKCNVIRVTTSECGGQVGAYRLTVRSNDSGVPNPLFTEVREFQNGYYYVDHFIPETLSYSTIYTVEVEILTTQNPLDYARIHEINPIYRVDVTDYVTGISTERVRDLHESSLPIGGTSSNSFVVNLDNTGKDFNLLSATSLYGQYVAKDLAVHFHAGWRLIKGVPDVYDMVLTSSISSSDTAISLRDAGEILPLDGQPFVLEINPGTASRELIVCNAVNSDVSVTAINRGFNNTVASSHSAGSTVRYYNYEYVDMGTFYTDEWQYSSDMSVSVSCSDKSKFLSERTIKNGFLLEKATATEAVENLLLFANFANKDYKSLNLFSRGIAKDKGILHLKFEDNGFLDDSTNITSVRSGLRGRLYGMPADYQNEVRNIKADSSDKGLTQLDRALGLDRRYKPDLVVESRLISTSSSYALDLDNYTFTATEGTTYSNYFNGVFDGYFVPSVTGNHRFSLPVLNGGIRMYLNDLVVIEKWSASTYGTTEVQDILLTAGVPQKVRIEFFHTVGDFDLTFEYAYEYEIDIGGVPTLVYTSDAPVPASMCWSTVCLDSIGSKDASALLTAYDPNNQRNSGLYLTANSNIAVNNTQMALSSSVQSEPDGRSVSLVNDSYIRIPNHNSWNLSNSSSNTYTGEWSIEAVVKANAYSGDGEYISCWSNASPTSGFEFYSNSVSNGFKIITSAGTDQVHSNAALSNSEFSHLTVTFKDSALKYFVNGDLIETESVSGSVLSWDSDLTIGGRGAEYANSAEVAPSLLRDLSIDHFIMYNKALTDEEVADRYTESKMKEIHVFDYLFANDESIREAIDRISLADLGRMYIDESDKSRYEHYFRYFENTIDQHATVQATISDSNLITDASFNLQLQVNKVKVSIKGVAANINSTQSLWRAEDPTTLGVVKLSSNISASDTDMYVNFVNDIPFNQAGYIKIDSEIIKYNSKNGNSFGSLERGKFDTTPASHTANTAIYEARYFEFEYDKAPALQVKDPLIAAVRFESRPLINIDRYNSGPYGGDLLLSASNNNPIGSIVYAEGTNPYTNKVYFTAIAGTPVIVTSQSSQVKDQTAESAESIRKYGLKEIIIDNEYINDFDYGQMLADFIVEKNANPVPVIEITTTPYLTLQVGDRIRIADLDIFDIEDGDYWIISISSDYVGMNQNIVLRKVV